MRRRLIRAGTFQWVVGVLVLITVGIGVVFPTNRDILDDLTPLWNGILTAIGVYNLLSGIYTVRRGIRWGAWVPFGTNVYYDGPLEFSKETDPEDGMPLYERRV